MLYYSSVLEKQLERNLKDIILSLKKQKGNIGLCISTIRNYLFRAQYSSWTFSVALDICDLLIKKYEIK